MYFADRLGTVRDMLYYSNNTWFAGNRNDFVRCAVGHTGFIIFYRFGTSVRKRVQRKAGGGHMRSFAHKFGRISKKNTTANDTTAAV